jgi:hypothetical protein
VFPEEDVTTFAAPEGDGRTWDASMLAISIGYSKMLTDRFSFGAQFKFIRETNLETQVHQVLRLI